MTAGGKQKPYLDAWLRRTRRELSGSGKLSELAMILAREGGPDAPAWRTRLHRIIEGEDKPDFELLTRIDSLLARPGAEADSEAAGADLFD